MTTDIDLTPAERRVIVTHGDAWSLKVTFPRTLAGATIAAQLRARHDSPDAINLNISTPVDAGGTSSFFIGQDAASVDGYFDVQITEAGALPRTYLAFRLSVKADVTRP